MGVYLLRLQSLPPRNSPQQTLEIASLERHLPAVLTEQVEQRLGIKIKWHVFANMAQLLSSLTEKPNQLDIALIFAHQVDQLTENYPLRPWSAQNIPNATFIQADFRSREPAHLQTIPISWFLTGFLYAKNRWPRPPHQIKDLFAHRILLPNHPEMSYSLVKDGDWIQEEWVRELQTDKLRLAFQKLNKKIVVHDQALPLSLADLQDFAILAPHSQAQSILTQNPDWDFWLPEGQAQLWVRVAGIFNHSRRAQLAEAFLNDWLDPAANTTFTQGLNEASTLSSEFTPILPEHLTADYLRKIPLPYYQSKRAPISLHPVWRSAHSEANWLASAQ